MDLTREYCCTDICAGCMNYSAPTKRHDETQDPTQSRCRVQARLQRELVAECKLDAIPNGASYRMQARSYGPILLSNLQVENDQQTSSQLPWYQKGVAKCVASSPVQPPLYMAERTSIGDSAKKTTSLLTGIDRYSTGNTLTNQKQLDT